jgi:hypothetical protein
VKRVPSLKSELYDFTSYFNAQEGFMIKKTISRGLMTALLVGVFALGYLFGSVNQRQADAQIGGLLEQAGKGGGALGSVTQLGSSIVEMQDHVNGLQKNLETLRKVQSALGGK